ncbi:MAG: hypothetical protein P1V20_08495 [Verrucomicrobiales bacterium]|nr:hypothetical protein [Verrucomicrobiales bacterium]
MRYSVFFVIASAVVFSGPIRGGDLTPGQIESLRLKLTQVKENLDGHLSSRNQSARSVFMAASNDPRAAVRLYLDCHKKVEYDMEGRSEADFRAWRDSQEARIKDKQFIESLLIQLRYLALSCHAAEVEKLDEVFGPLNSYVESLSRLEELPDRILTSNVSNSIFAKAYNLEKLLGGNEGWESVPFNIPGIYEKTILPHLRATNPDLLLSAWDKRIEQQKRLVLFFEAKKQEELRGMDRDQKIRARTRQENRGGLMKSHDLEDFNRETLPRLQWDKMKDKFAYIDQLSAAQEMLAFVEANLTTPKGGEYFKEFSELLENSNQVPTQ